MTGKSLQRLGEALAVVVRFISNEITIEQRLVKLQMLAKSMKGEEIARELISVLSATYGIGSGFLLAAMRDRASVNNVALATLKVVYPMLVDIGCYSHTINHVGERFSTPTLSEFLTAWGLLFSHSPKTRLLWREKTGKSMGSYSPTRWWSKWELMNQLLFQFGDVRPFLEEHEDLGPATRQKLLGIVTDPQRNVLLQIELAAVVDCGEPFVKATYTLEGDGPLVLECFEIISTIQAAIHAGHMPNVRAVVENLSSGTTVQQSQQQQAQQQLVAYARSCVLPGITYFQEQLQSSLKSSLLVFKAACLFSPQKANLMQPNAAAVDDLAAFPFLNTQTILDDLKAELPLYLAKAADVDSSIDALDWWKKNANCLPKWVSALQKILLIQPSSAAIERVFSLLKSSFSEQQECSLQDYVEASIMLQYNKR